MARRIFHSRQIPARNQHHNNAIHTAHAQELSATLAEEPTAGINQLLEIVLRCLHRELQVHLRATSITRGVKGRQARNQGVPASIHPVVDYTQELSRGHIRRERNLCIQERPAMHRLQGTARTDEGSNTRTIARASQQLGRRRRSRAQRNRNPNHALRARIRLPHQRQRTRQKKEATQTQLLRGQRTRHGRGRFRR